jgi:hypothetical protein
MVHERDDEYEGQEDGEYHFSDDQANYEMEPEITTKTDAPAAPKPAPVSAGTSKNLRRPVLGVVVFVLVIFLVYKIISPSSSVPPTDFSQTTSASTKTMTTRQPVEKTTVVTTTTSTPARVAAPPPVTTVTTVTAPVQQQPQQIVQPIQTTMPAQPLPAQQPQQVPAPEMSSAQASSAIDKLIQLQDQNTKLITQYQTESAQKIAEYETQNNELQGKLQDMALRLNALETTITHLTKALQDARGGGAGMASNNNANSNGGGPVTNGASAGVMPADNTQVVMARPMAVPKSMYSVQAIIPGRAWLKSDNGETVTVAEGDILKNYGKIIKIDPYDGVVQIDAGGRTVTLSYGATTE